MKRAYVVVLNWNGWSDTLECLESVFRLDYPELRVIVCDNASTDGSIERIVSWAEGDQVADPKSNNESVRRLSLPGLPKPIDFALYDRQQAENGGNRDMDPPLVLIRTGANLGFSGGNNVGLRYAMVRRDFDFVWLLNNDTVVHREALAAMINRMAEKPDAGMCGSTLLYYEDPNRIQARGGGWYCRWIGLPWHLGRFQRADAPCHLQALENRMNYVVGASILVSKRFLEEVGLLCEDYFLYFEETDWALRGRGRFSLAYAQESLVYHKVGASIGTSSNPAKKSRTCDYYSIRNRLLFTRRFYPIALPTVYMTAFIACLVRLLCGRPDLAFVIWNLLRGRTEGLVEVRE